MSDMVFCKGCGKELHVTALSCPHCGAQQQLTPIGSKNKLAAALLGLFLGPIGIQKFYLGKTGQGILCILFFWTFIPTIIGIVDFVIYITMSDSEFNHRFNQLKQLES